MKQIGIIGAGASGLCALRHVLATPGLNPVIWEHSSVLGGTWVYTSETGLDKHKFPIHSSMYSSLRTNLPKEIMGFPDYQFKNGEKSFVHHTEVLQYLNDYTEHFSLRPWIKFEHRVTAVERTENAVGETTWQVTTKNLKDGSVSSTVCDGLLVCSGHYSVPRTPDIKGLKSFKGRTSHSHDYRYPEPYRDRSVIVLGAAASGMDISLEVSTVARKVYLSHNFPLPLPSKLPDNVIQVRGISEAVPNGFLLTDGSEVHVDDLIFCTGYEYDFPYFTPSCEVTIENNRVKPVYKHVIHSTYPSMGFIGLVFQVLPFPLFDMQVQYFLAAFQGRLQLPSEDDMKHEIDKEIRANAEGGKPLHHYHLLGPNQWKYVDELGSAIGSCNPALPFLQELYDLVWKRRIFSLGTYKDIDYICQFSESSEYQIEEYLDGKKLNTSFSLLVLTATQLTKLILFNFPLVLRLVVTRMSIALSRFFH